jgi:hypothetical protein
MESHDIPGYELFTAQDVVIKGDRRTDRVGGALFGYFPLLELWLPSLYLRLMKFMCVLRMCTEKPRPILACSRDNHGLS